jgi:hypothetical protein
MCRREDNIKMDLNFLGLSDSVYDLAVGPLGHENGPLASVISGEFLY